MRLNQSSDERYCSMKTCAMINEWIKVAALAAAIGFVVIVKAEQEVSSPYAKGGEVSVVETAYYKRYIHVFTNTAAVAQFRNKSSQALRGRILVVGAGGAGGYGMNSMSGGGGGYYPMQPDLCYC